MIIQCPACATRYEVPDGAIGNEGRTVRCAKCKHSWHATAIDEDGPEPDGAATRGAPATDEMADARSQLALAEEPRIDAADKLGQERTPRTALTKGGSAASVARGGGSGDDEAIGVPRGSRRMWNWAAVILAIMVAAAIAAIAMWGMPEWVPGGRESFAAEPDLVLEFPDDQQGMRQLPNGTEFFGASGTITNTGSTTKRVPPILVVLRDSRERIVYSFEVMPPKHSLQPGESMAVSEAVTEVPRSARVADIGWKPG